MDGWMDGWISVVVKARKGQIFYGSTHMDEIMQLIFAHRTFCIFTFTSTTGFFGGQFYDVTKVATIHRKI
jgi:hypothetical protein